MNMEQPTENLLHLETSPYLRQHKDNPVHWLPWGPEALALARALDRPVLLSIGYAACHWCHVMAHESFEDAATADIMNACFINIKLDREERPDVDGVYQNALALMGRQGGWPLTIFLTPDGSPFWGGTYFPAHARHGLPAFREVLRGIDRAWREERGPITHNAGTITTALTQLQVHQSGPVLTQVVLDSAARAIAGMTDFAHGGFGAAAGPKFPCLPALSFLWSCARRQDDAVLRDVVVSGLLSMCQGGLYDHVGGGFARYCVDGEWLVPHFEKMLYDNAQFVRLLTDVYAATKHPVFAARAAETVQWLLREMTVTDAKGRKAFAASLDADSDTPEGDRLEGAFYVWQAAEIEALLGAEDATFFCAAYDISRPGNWEERPGFSVPNRLQLREWQGEETEARLRNLCRRLADARSARPAPARDGKVLADWNGMAIAALSHAAGIFEKPEWLAAAQGAFDFVIANHAAGEARHGMPLYHNWCDGRGAHAALLDDYAHMIDAALHLHAATGDGVYLEHADGWIDILCREYHDADTGGFFTTAATAAEHLPVRPRHADDTAVPAGNSVLAAALAGLYAVTGQARYAALAEEILHGFSGTVTNHPFGRAALLSAAMALTDPVVIVLAGAPAAQAAFAVVARAGLPPHGLVLGAGPGAVFPALHAAAGKPVPATGGVAYVCRGQNCLPPATTPGQLQKTLAEIARSRRSGVAANEP